MKTYILCHSAPIHYLRWGPIDGVVQHRGGAALQ